MRVRIQILAMVAIALALSPGDASAYVYGYDPAKTTGDGLYMELAQDPTFITGGIHDGKYEYFFDVYTTGGTFYFYSLVGLEHSKIANVQSTSPDGGAFKTQRWGDPNGYANHAAWGDTPGRILDTWSTGSNDTLTKATNPDRWKSSYDDTLGGWTDSGLGFVNTNTNNPHSQSDYVPHGSGSNREIWKTELTGPGMSVHWWLTQFGVVPTEEIVLTLADTIWAPPFPDNLGRVSTMRIVYDEPIDPDNIGWGLGAAADYPVLGDFTVPLPPACGIGDADCDGDVDLDDIIAAVGAFTGPCTAGVDCFGDVGAGAPFDKVRADGDVNNGAPVIGAPPLQGDGDVDLDDIIDMVGAFTGPLDGEGAVHASAGDPGLPDLCYDSLTGEVFLDGTDIGGGLQAYNIKNAGGGILNGNFNAILGGPPATNLTTEIGEFQLSSTPTPPGGLSIGFVFPAGMDQAQLEAFVTGGSAAPSFGGGSFAWELIAKNVVGGEVPEPSTFILGGLGLLGLALVGYRRRRAA